MCKWLGGMLGLDPNIVVVRTSTIVVLFYCMVLETKNVISFSNKITNLHAS